MGKDGPKDCRVTRYQLSDGSGRDHGQKRGVGFGTSRRSPAQTLTTFCLFAGRFDLLDNLRSGDSSCATVSRRLKKAEEIRVLRRVLLSNMECLSHSIYALLRASLQIQIHEWAAGGTVPRQCRLRFRRIGMRCQCDEEQHGKGARCRCKQSPERNVVTFDDVLHVRLQNGVKHGATCLRCRCEKSRRPVYFLIG